MKNKDFEQAVIQTIHGIPAGYVATYGMVAKVSGYPGYSRQVGFVLKNLPRNSNLPWHRVVNSQGKSSFPVDSKNFQIQLDRLHSEGVEWVGNKLKLQQYSFWPIDL